jgi:ATP-dependent RNA helicase DeaD
MQSFEDLGVTPEITEALAAEGIEFATPLQAATIPVVRQGNNVILEAGPGAGVLVAWAAGLLDRIDTDGDGTKALVLCATRDVADRLAESTARLSAGTDHRVGALGSSWVLAERADFLFATTEDALAALGAGALAVEGLQAIVIDQAHLVEEVSGLAQIERVFEYGPAGTQRILSALPLTDGVSDLADRHFKRAVTLPSEEGDAPARGGVRFRITAEPREAGALRVIGDVLNEGARHALVYCRTEDRAADLGDYLTLHGFAAGAPGDTDVPVWLGVDALEARAAAKDIDGVVVVSCDVPADTDTLDRRHSMSGDGVVVLLPREVTHLKKLGRRTGYDTVPFPPSASGPDPLAALRATLEDAIATEDTAPYMLALEPLLERYDAVEIAAAAVALLRRARSVSTPALTGASAASPQFAPRPPANAPAGAVPSWSKLFVSVGERDGVRKGDLLGAITGEANVPGDAVGKIEIRESHTLVEVHDTVAQQVIRAINGTTIKGRSARVDFDRPRKAPPRRGRPSQD